VTVKKKQENEATDAIGCLPPSSNFLTTFSFTFGCDVANYFLDVALCFVVGSMQYGTIATEPTLTKTVGLDSLSQTGGHCEIVVRSHVNYKKGATSAAGGM